MKINDRVIYIARTQSSDFHKEYWTENSSSERDHIKLLSKDFDFGESIQYAISIMCLDKLEIEAEAEVNVYQDLVREIKRNGLIKLSKLDRNLRSADDIFENPCGYELLRTLEDTEEHHAILFFGFLRLFKTKKFKCEFIPALRKVLEYTENNKQAGEPSTVKWPDIPARNIDEKINFEVEKKVMLAEKLIKEFGLNAYVIEQKVLKGNGNDFVRANGLSHIVDYDGSYSIGVSVRSRVDGKEIKDFLDYRKTHHFNYSRGS